MTVTDTLPPGGDGGSGVESRVLSTLLNEMDGITASAGLLVVAATNRPDLIDEALLRPGGCYRLLFTTSNMPPS